MLAWFLVHPLGMINTKTSWLLTLQNIKIPGRSSQNRPIPEKNQELKEELILNSINVLMKRGIKGLYTYATDPQLSARLLELQSK